MLKLCPRCNGNMLLEEFLSETEFVCIQCGHRVDAQPNRRKQYPVITKKAA
jgi:hypothetical protein